MHTHQQIGEKFGFSNQVSSLLSLFVGVSVFAAAALADGPAIPAGGVGSTGAAPLAGQAPGFASMLFPFAAMFAVVYFLMIRPQQKKMKEQQNMLTELKHGDEVLTTSGILGTVAGLTDKVVTLEIADNVKIKMLKTQISQVLKGPIQDNVA
jgi:preprotein translocase subunit YajC